MIQLKKILVGKGGQQIKKIGTAARLDLEEFLERPVYLELHVRQSPLRIVSGTSAIRTSP